MIFAIVAAILAYRRANEHGRNGWLWAFIAAAVFVGTQLVISLGAGVLMGLGVAFFGWPDDIFDNTLYVGPITVVSIGASIGATWLLLRYLDRPTGPEASELPPPPPPPTFGQSS